MLDKTMRRKTFRHKRGEMLADWRKSQSDRFHCFYSSLDIVRFVRSRQVRWKKHVACIGEEKHVKGLMESLEQMGG